MEKRWSGNITLTVVFDDFDRSDWEIHAISRDTGEVIAASKGNLHTAPFVTLKDTLIGGTDYLFQEGQATANLRDIVFVIRQKQTESRLVLNSVIISDSSITKGVALLHIVRSNEETERGSE